MATIEDYDDEGLIEICQAYAEDHPTFDTTFVDSLYDQICEGRCLTDHQRAGLVRIVDKFRMIKDD